jgi:hypothetical protein
MDRLLSKEREHIGLPTAMSVVYLQVTGLLLPADESRRVVLNDVAHAVSMLVPIFAADGHAVPRAIDDADLIGATFSRGARVLTTSAGRKYLNLTVQRGDMKAAIAVMRAAKIDFRKRASATKAASSR